MANCMVKLLGGIDKYLSALIVFITINYITEILLAIVGEERYSKMFLFKNILKKVAIFILVVVSNVVGTIIESNCAIRTTVILFYISNEGLAILKNIKRFEVPLPRILIELLDRIENGKYIILNRSFLCCFSDGKKVENMIKYINKFWK